jgi:hypothetical protein
MQLSVTRRYNLAGMNAGFNDILTFSKNFGLKWRFLYRKQLCFTPKQLCSVPKQKCFASKQQCFVPKQLCFA